MSDNGGRRSEFQLPSIKTLTGSPPRAAMHPTEGQGRPSTSQSQTHPHGQQHRYHHHQQQQHSHHHQQPQQQQHHHYAYQQSQPQQQQPQHAQPQNSYHHASQQSQQQQQHHTHTHPHTHQHQHHQQQPQQPATGQTSWTSSPHNVYGQPLAHHHQAGHEYGGPPHHSASYGGNYPGGFMARPGDGPTGQAGQGHYVASAVAGPASGYVHGVRQTYSAESSQPSSGSASVDVSRGVPPTHHHQYVRQAGHVTGIPPGGPAAAAEKEYHGYYPGYGDTYMRQPQAMRVTAPVAGPVHPVMQTQTQTQTLTPTSSLVSPMGPTPAAVGPSSSASRQAPAPPKAPAGSSTETMRRASPSPAGGHAGSNAVDSLDEGDSDDGSMNAQDADDALLKRRKRNAQSAARLRERRRTREQELTTSCTNLETQIHRLQEELQDEKRRAKSDKSGRASAAEGAEPVAAAAEGKGVKRGFTDSEGDAVMGERKRTRPLRELDQVRLDDLKGKIETLGKLNQQVCVNLGVLRQEIQRISQAIISQKKAIHC
ncbi:hypothetical protein GGI15_004539 [Coemansia interrupta]|uniref:BZIP domain-containing protein n=1 Tax=Coemansia interrupta TaxID=1126814 RepID=A0A9W8H6P9_9FUNG|nr:hypothetical protein GGI15_004539 [Coemansia interrupta]